MGFSCFCDLLLNDSYAGSATKLNLYPGTRYSIMAVFVFNAGMDGTTEWKTAFYGKLNEISSRMRI